MAGFRFKNVCLEALATYFPSTQLSSAELEDSVAPVYERLGLPFGTLERLTGVANRFIFDPFDPPSRVGTEAARLAIEASGIDPKNLKALLSCSVSRDYFEPATGVLMHKNLGLDEDALALDVSNACLGFSNGVFFVSNLIESGVIKAGVVVSGENIRSIIDNTRKHLLEKPELTREQIIKMLPSFTLGCGAVAFVLCHESVSVHKRRILGGVMRSASQHADLCVGNADFSMFGGEELIPIMETESSKLIASAALLGQRTWRDASEVLGWSRQDVDHVFCHQVGRQVNEAFYNTMGLDMEKEFTIYKQYGNMVSVALPAALTLGAEAGRLKKGDKIVLTGFGSGLNSLFMGIEW